MNDIEFPEMPVSAEREQFGAGAMALIPSGFENLEKVREAMKEKDMDVPPLVEKMIEAQGNNALGNMFAGINRDRLDRYMKERNAYELQMAALPAEQRQIVEKYFNGIDTRFANRSARMDVYAKIANGERNVETLGLGRFDGETQYAMLRAMKGVVEWDSVNAELRQGGVDLKKELDNSQFVELKNNPAKQMVVKQYLVREMQKYKAENNVWPNVDQRQRMINSAIAGAKTPADEVNTKLQNITAQGYFDRALMSSDKIYKTKDTTYQKRYDIISDAIDDVISDGSLNQLQRETVRMYREQIIQAAMSGSPLPVLEDILGVY